PRGPQPPPPTPPVRALPPPDARDRVPPAGVPERGEARTPAGRVRFRHLDGEPAGGRLRSIRGAPALRVQRDVLPGRDDARRDRPPPERDERDVLVLRHGRGREPQRRGCVRGHIHGGRGPPYLVPPGAGN